VAVRDEVVATLATPLAAGLIFGAYEEGEDAFAMPGIGGGGGGPPAAAFFAAKYEPTFAGPVGGGGGTLEAP
jgi:hypothetical protein